MFNNSNIETHFIRFIQKGQIKTVLYQYATLFDATLWILDKENAVSLSSSPEIFPDQNILSDINTNSDLEMKDVGEYVWFWMPITIHQLSFGFLIGRLENKDGIIAKIKNFAELIVDTICYRFEKEFELEDITKELLEQYEYLELLHNISCRITSHLDLFSTKKSILEETTDIINAEDCALLLFENEEESQHLYVDAVNRYFQLETNPPTSEHGLDERVIQRMINDGEIVIENQMTTETYLVKDDPSTKIRSLLCVPMKTKEAGVVGGIVLINKVGYEGFTSIDKKIMVTLATQAGHMLKNASLFQHLKREKKNIERIMNTAADAIIVTDQNFRIVRINQSSQKLFNLENGQNSNHKLAVILYKLEHHQDEATYFDIALMKPENVILSVRAKKLFNEHQERAGWVISLQNITELKHDDRKHRETISFLSQHLPQISYDLILFLSDKFKQTGENEEFYYQSMVYAQDIHKRTTRLWNFLQIIAGPLRLERINVDLVDIVKEAVVRQEPYLKYKNIEIKLDLPNEPLIMRVDLDWGEQLIDSLLENAIINSPSNKIVHVELIDEIIKTIIRITNEGRGIRAEEKEWIFDPLKQLDEVEQMRLDEIRMGLPFAKHIVDAHGGTLSISTIDETPDQCIVEIELPRIRHFF